MDSDYLYKIGVAGTYAHHLVNFLHFGQASQARKSYPGLRRIIKRVKQFLPQRSITLHEKAVLERTRRAGLEIIRLQGNVPLNGV